MFALGALSFVAPVALLALAALPVLWWLLRVIPPAPKRIRFPPIRLIMRLVNPEETSAKTPLWLTLLRVALIILVILGAAHPIVNAGRPVAGGGPLVLAIDDDWSAARNWSVRQQTMASLLDRAERDGRAVAILTTAPGESRSRPLDSLMTPEAARDFVHAVEPKPWPTDRAAAGAQLDNLQLKDEAEVVWLSNGLDEGTASDFAAKLRRLGPVTVLAEDAGAVPTLVLPPTAERSGLVLHAKRPSVTSGGELKLQVKDDRGGTVIRKTLTFDAGKTEGDLALDMPVELRNRVAAIEAEDQKSAGSIVLVDERWRRRPVGIVSGADRRSDQPLLDDVYYLDRALDPFTEVRNGTISDLLKREVALLILPDTGKPSDAERKQLETWISKGGVALRFAGPQLAAATNDTLLPVRLRQGDRDLGGALSWTKPAQLAPFDENSPFAGIPIPPDVRIRRQVLAQPTVDLADKTWARLQDGTPLVTAEKRGDGWLVFVHTTASPEWSNLPLSGMFVSMLRNLVQLSRGVAGGADERLLTPLQTVDGYGRLGQARPGARALKGNAFETTVPGPDHPPGFYGDDSARRAFNLSSKIASLDPIGSLGSNVTRGSYEASTERDLRGGLLLTALLLALIDIVASLALRGFFNLSRGVTAGLLALTLAAAAVPAHAQVNVAPAPVPQPAENDTRPFASALTVRLAYVRTGDADIDRRSQQGLSGLSFVANTRTAAELGEPVGVDPGTDDLSFYPLIYWPITDDAPLITQDTADRLNKFMKSGGTILFDTRDGNGQGTQSARLQDISRFLDLPPLVVMPSDHVLTKAYYLLREMPGRWTGGRIWVERQGARINDGVSAVIVGAHDWASAWAVDDSKKPIYPVVPGGERQREMAYRFGINLIMYALTGNYKDDQVHLPAILERLGQ